MANGSPSEGNDAPSSGFGSKLLKILAIVGGVGLGFLALSPGVRAAVVSGSQETWAAMSDPSRNGWNSITSMFNRGPQTPPFPTSQQAPPHLRNPNGLIQQAPNLLQ
ncbi:MAG: hypothetical protein HOO67_02770 [Candidatus Peribacteraceae bacterium]|nr:hypothetical protein [Candidatus Peribacteraceae bacterium]